MDLYSKPAILGGQKSVTICDKEANRWPIVTEDDFIAVKEILNDGKLNNHPIIRTFEQDCRDYFGVKYVLAHCNGTAALLAAFFALELQPGDEIIVPTATFWASVLPMLWIGAVPIFCESESDTLGLDVDDLEKKITNRTKAIVAVHLWGLPCKMDKIQRIAQKYNLKIIEDASHSQGAEYNGKKCGTLTDIGVISLVGNKLLPAGEGGLFLTDKYEYFEKAACLGDIARIMELKTATKRFAATGFGVKTRIASLSAAIGRSQLQHLDERNTKRNANLSYLSQHLEQLGFGTFLPPSNCKRVYFEFIIKYNAATIPLSQQLLVAALKAEGCAISLPRYPLLHKQPIFTEGHYKKILRQHHLTLPDYNLCDLPNTEAVCSLLLRLPTFPSADKKLLDQYITAFTKVISNSDAIKKAVANNKITVDADSITSTADKLLVL